MPPKSQQHFQALISLIVLLCTREISSLPFNSWHKQGVHKFRLCLHHRHSGARAQPQGFGHAASRARGSTTHGTMPPLGPAPRGSGEQQSNPRSCGSSWDAPPKTSQINPIHCSGSELPCLLPSSPRPAPITDGPSYKEVR